jgi:hypothetical protein
VAVAGVWAMAEYAEVLRLMTDLVNRLLRNRKYGKRLAVAFSRVTAGGHEDLEHVSLESL